MAAQECFVCRRVRNPLAAKRFVFHDEDGVRRDVERAVCAACAERIRFGRLLPGEGEAIGDRLRESLRSTFLTAVHGND